EPLLPWLAWSLSVDTWRSTWPVHIKRARIAAITPAVLEMRRQGIRDPDLDR
ncbi:phage tail protein I, partial [Xylella fastidiosa]|uniref:phage tail protein I n=1 Tax=Xylella fastidiosa TaxID=2371 RepID=UPI003CFC889F